jgi:hypothetical protein
MEHAPLDGNAAAGILAEIFVPELTAAATTCAGCGAVAAVGELHVYMQAPGTVLRCASCGQVELRVVLAPGRAWLDVRGLNLLQIGFAQASAGSEVVERDEP